MTREEAIEFLKFQRGYYCDLKRSEELQAYTMAIKALEQEICDDCISRLDVINAINQNCVFENEYNLTASRIKNLVQKLPSVAPHPKTGHWIYKLEDWNKWTCSECGWNKRTDVHVKLGYNYCPNCGCYMVESQESEK